MTLFARVYEYLLPRARAFYFWASASQLREFFEGLAGLPSDVRTFFDDLWDDTQPSTTRQLSEFEEQFGLPESGLSEAQRRVRLAAAWASTGGQSPRYLEDLIQASGFDVFIHEFWDPSALPARVVRNPNVFLTSGGADIVMRAGEVSVLCGEDHTDASFNGTIFDDLDTVCGETNDPVGYPLVNKIRTSATITLGADDPELECGEPLALCGQPLSVTFGEVLYPVPSDPDLWPYFLYYGGETFPDLAQVDGLRRGEFEDLILKYSPGQQWLGVLVEYV